MDSCRPVQRHSMNIVTQRLQAVEARRLRSVSEPLEIQGLQQQQQQQLWHRRQSPERTTRPTVILSYLQITPKPTPQGGAEYAVVENAGVEKAGIDSRGIKSGSKLYGIMERQPEIILREPKVTSLDLPYSSD